MGHEDKGHFAAKHTGKKINKGIAEKIRAQAVNQGITCASAHRIGKLFEVSPSEIGIQIDLLEYQIIECQMGLYGFSDGKKRIEPDIELTPDLNEHLDKTSKDGRISCLECWNIAKNLKCKRIDVGSACEKKNLKIKPCQLGAF